MKMSMISRTLMVGMLKPLNYVYQVHLCLPRLLGLLSLLSLLRLGAWHASLAGRPSRLRRPRRPGRRVSVKVSAIEELFVHAGGFPPDRARPTSGRRGLHRESLRPGGPAGSA